MWILQEVFSKWPLALLEPGKGRCGVREHGVLDLQLLRCWGLLFLNPVSPFFPHRTRQAAGERSKTVILVKNLPASTSVVELEDVFGKHGSLGRVLLPEGGITAIVEFLEPTEAKQAFTKLAYSKVSMARG